MSELNRNSPSHLTTEAADWYARSRAGDLTELDAARFKAWLARSPAHCQEFEAIGALWNDLAAIENMPEVVSGRRAARREDAVHADTLSSGAFGAGNVARPARRWRARRFIAVAASIVAAAGAAYWIRNLPTDHYTTGIGEQRVIPLRDGTFVTLNTATELKLHYSRTQRTVELISGQANFEVAKDPTRPFVVMAGGGEVRAVGTVFDVYKTPDRVTVTLIEGKVAVIPANQVPDTESDVEEESARHDKERFHSASDPSIAPAAPALNSNEQQIYLTAGQQLSYGTTTGSVRRAAADLPRVSAWKERKLDFDNTLLVDAIAEANRYSRVQIQLDAPQLQNARISGMFEAGKNEQFAEGLQSYFRMKADRAAENRIVLSAPH